jgi:hypothetical protein
MISAGRTAAALCGAHKALSAEFNSESSTPELQMLPRSMNGAFSDGGSYGLFAMIA